MKVTIELIDELRSRVNVSYEEARRVLEKNDGDLIKSIIELETHKSKRTSNPNSEQKEEVKRIANRILQYRFSISSKNGETLVDLPFILLVISAIFAFWLTLALFAVAILTSCHINVYRNEKAEYKEPKAPKEPKDSKTYDKVQAHTNDVDINDSHKNRTITQEIIKRNEKKHNHHNDDNNDNNKDNDDGDNEVIIE